MDRQFYIDLAHGGLRMPIGTDLVLSEKPDHAQIVLDGARLGSVIAESAARWRTPLAVGLMDLTLEKTAMLEALGLGAADPLTHHFTSPPPADAVEKITAPTARFNRQFQAHIDAVTHVARNHSELVPVGMSIGPFSLMTKLLADPLTPVFLAGSGLGPEDEESIALMLRAMELAEAMVLRNVEAQAKAGAKALLLAEPAANRVFIAPRLVEEGSDIWERLVMEPNRRLRNLLDKHGVDLMFHCCGELEPWMVRDFTTLQPVVLSLGASRRLWEDTQLVPNDIVLYGNLPTKNFYSDEAVPPSKVVEMSRELHSKMRAAGHPFILGSECDVLSVTGKEDLIRRKVDLFMTCELE